MWGFSAKSPVHPAENGYLALSRGDKTIVCIIIPCHYTTVVQVGLCVSTPQLVGAVQCSCEYLARLQEFVIAQAHGSLSCAQRPQYLIRN